MSSKNRPKELIEDIINSALEFAREDYPEERGYVVSKHENEIWVDKKIGKGDDVREVLTIGIERDIV